MIRSYIKSFAFIKGNRPLQSLIGTVFLAELAYAILNLSAMPVYVKYSLNKGAMLGVIISTFLLTEAVSKPFFGALGDKIGRKYLLLAGPLLTAITALLTAQTHSVVFLIGMRIVDGLGCGALWPSAYATIGDIVEEKQTSSAMSLLNVTYMGGLALAFILGGVVNQFFNSTTASFYLVTVILIFAVLVIVVSFPGKIDKIKNYSQSTIARERQTAKWSTILRSFREIPDMMTLAGAAFLGIGMLAPIVKLYGLEHLHLSEAQFGTAVAPIAILMGVLAVPLGKFSDRYGRNLTLSWSLFLCSLAMFSFVLFKSWVTAGMAAIIIGLGFTAAFPAWNSLLVSTTSSQRRGEMLGAVGMIQGLAAIVGAIAGSFLYEKDYLSIPRLGINNYNLPFWLSGIFLYVGTLIAFMWVFAKRGDKDPVKSIKPWHKKSIVVAGIVGLVVIGSWIGFRYTQPIPADRVTWEFVQELAQNNPEKATDFAVNDNIGIKTQTEKAAKLYSEWVNEKRAHYTVQTAAHLPNGDVLVKIYFTFPGNARKIEEIQLTKAQDGEWRVHSIHGSR